MGARIRNSTAERNGNLLKEGTGKQIT